VVKVMGKLSEVKSFTEMASGCPESRSLASICESPRQSVGQIRRRCHPVGGHLVLRSKNKKTRYVS
jgi:hypothetical protein